MVEKIIRERTLLMNMLMNTQNVIDGRAQHLCEMCDIPSLS